MDTTEPYIKMCEKAKELQEPTEFEAGDFWCWNWETKEVIVAAVSGGERGKGLFGNRIWLPRQDQLQAMISNHWGDTYYALSDWLESLDENYPCGKLFYSWEQLWLAFLFAEKYGKYWDGSDWVLKK